MYTSAVSGVAVLMSDGMITISAESCVIFTYNHASLSGVILLTSATLIIDSEANLTFSHNSADSGGALELDISTIHVNTSGIKFYDNRVSVGGAVDSFYGTMIISTNISVNFIMNSARVQGGEIYIRAGVRPSIIVDNYS